MDHIPPREQDYAVDLEFGGATGEEVASPGPASVATLAKFSKFCRGFVSNDGSVKGENGAIALNSSEVSPINVKLVIDKKVEEGEEVEDDLVEKKMGKKKNKKASAKKPPRPPRGLSLDAADQKLIREITEIAMLKRARIERMKALKKMKASKASSSSSSSGNLFAMLFTILFCLVILFQGMSSGSSTVGFQGSPESAQETEGSFIFVSSHWNPYSSNTKIPGPASPSLVEQVAGLDGDGKVSRAAG